MYLQMFMVHLTGVTKIIHQISLANLKSLTQNYPTVLVESSIHYIGQLS
jgi:hypothetical protein